MPHKKREYILYSFYDRTGIENHLEQMAAKGWMVERMGRMFWTYRRTEPKAVHFSVVYFAPASEFDCAPGEAQQTFQDYCAAAGWTLAASWSQMLIFASEAPSPTPIETDAAVQVEAVHQAMKKNFLLSYGIMFALSLFLFFSNLSSLYNHPTDFLANPGSLSTLALWPLVSLLCATEIASYFLWRRKARRTADEEGRFTPTRGHRCLWLTIDLLSDACLISLFFSVSPRIALLLVIVLVVVVALQGLLAGLRYLLRHTGWSTEVNRLVTQILSFLVALVVILGVNRGAVRLIREEPWRETYTWQGDKYDVHPIDLPLTLEDLTGESYEHVSRDLIETRTYFLSRLNCREVVGQPQVTLSYTVTDIRRPWLRDTVIQDYLENTDLVGYISTHKLTIHRSWEPEDPTAWGADAAYRRYFGSEHAPSGDFLLLYGDRIVEFEPNRELTDAQRAVVGKKLAPHT